MSTPNKFAALDSNFLLALEAGDDECAEAVDGLQRHGFYFIVTETVLQEIADIVEKDEDPENQHHARNTLVQLTNWGFLTPSLGTIEMGVALQVGNNLVASLMPDGHVNDGLVLAEAAYNKCRLLITTRNIILTANRNAIQVSLINADLNAVVVASPAEIKVALTAIGSTNQ